MDIFKTPRAKVNTSNILADVPTPTKGSEEKSKKVDDGKVITESEG